MSKSIYDQHDAAFSNVQAFVILNGAKDRVATVAIKFPRDGAGRLYAYVHWIGTPMVRGYANGFGYDKRSAAVASAARRMPVTTPEVEMPGREEYNAFVQAMMKDSGHSWDRELENAGFTVLQAV